jgi:ribonuclease D
MALGLGEQVGYSNLVESLLGRTLDKGARFTDWGATAARPAPDRLCDRRRHPSRRTVPAMLERLRRTRRGEWLDQEMERIRDPANYVNDPPRPGRRSRSRAASPRCSAG